jgi:hypothetical protein
MATADTDAGGPQRAAPPPGGDHPDHRRTRILALALLAVLVVTLTAAWWTKGRCLLDGGWEAGEQYTGWCYTDILPLWFAEELNVGATPYVDHAVEYPVLIGGQMWVAAGLVRAFVFDKGSWSTGFFTVNVLLAAPMYLVAAYRMFRMGVTPARLLWAFAAPTFVIYAFMNWDAMAVMLAVIAIDLHRRNRDLGAGIAAGLGTAAKLFPAFLVPIIILARWSQGRRRDAVVHGAAAAGAWLVVNVPVMIAAPSGWAEFLRLNRTRSADWDSLWFFWQQVRGSSFDVSTLNLLTAGLFVAGSVAIVLIGRRLLPASDQWRLLLPVLCWFLLTNKVYSPQFSIWLLPLMALALPRAPAFAAFAVADLFVFAIRFPYLGGRQDYTPAPGYDLFAVAILVRAAVLVWVIVETMRASPPPLVERPSPFPSVPRTSDRQSVAGTP